MVMPYLQKTRHMLNSRAVKQNLKEKEGISQTDYIAHLGPLYHGVTNKY